MTLHTLDTGCYMITAAFYLKQNGGGGGGGSLEGLANTVYFELYHYHF